MSMRVMLRDLLRQRFRTALTISGVGLGIFTLIVLGALGDLIVQVGRHDAAEYARSTAVEVH